MAYSYFDMNRFAWQVRCTSMRNVPHPSSRTASPSPACSTGSEAPFPRSKASPGCARAAARERRGLPSKRSVFHRDTGILCLALSLFTVIWRVSQLE